jgi:hypothetical protein
VCAGQRLLVDLVASTHELELFSTTPAELAARNRRQRRATTATTDHTTAPATPVPAAGAGHRSALVGDAAPQADTPAPLALFPRRPRP